MGSGRALTLFLAVQTFGSIKHGTQNDCIEQNAIKKEENLTLVALNRMCD